jgi:hypothetical protein
MAETTYPVTLQIERPATSSRICALFTIIPFKFMALVMQNTVQFFISIVFGVVFIIAEFAVLFTGVYPRGMHAFMVKVTY